MTYHDSKCSEVGNMSKAEAFLRGVVGMALIEPVIAIPSLSETTLAVLVAISIYTVISAIMRWDPFYALLGNLDRQASSAPIAVALRPEPDTAVEVAHKKAA